MSQVDWSDLLAHVGSLDQVVSVTPVEYLDGAARGVRALDVRSLGGLHVTVLLDRGMDLGQVWYRGIPLAWISPVGPARTSAAADEDWLGAFHGGLLVTAGTQNVGRSAEAGGVRHGLHGRLSMLPARDLIWHVDPSRREIVVEGTIREARVLGYYIELRRRLRFGIDSPTLAIEDVFANEGSAPAPVMVLYHFNLGWPLVSETSRLYGWPAEVTPREGDAAAAEALPTHDRFLPPTAGWRSQMFEHHGSEVSERTVGVANPEYPPGQGVAAEITYRPAQLPRLWRWRMFDHKTYLVSIEPTNTSLEGRGAAQELPLLDAGRQLTFELSFRVRVGN